MGPVGRRRVSYVIPPPTEPVPRLQLPPIHTPASAPRSSAPLLLPAPAHPALPPKQRAPAHAQHPRHRLGVACLALDAATVRGLLAASIAAIGVQATWDDVTRPVLAAVAQRWADTGAGIGSNTYSATA